MRREPASRQEIFGSSFSSLERNLESLVQQVLPLSYQQRGWIRETLEAGADILRQRGGPDTSALDHALANPPPNMPPQVVELVRDRVSEAIGLPESAPEREAVRRALEGAANAIVSGPASRTARAFQQRWQRLKSGVPKKIRE